MSFAGFKKGLFGFNREDVNRYIEQLHKKSADNESELKNELQSLRSRVQELETQNTQLSSDIVSSQEKLKVLEEKEEEIERLSQGIGTLYLVAKTNAEEMLKHAVNGSSAAMEETSKNLKAIESAQSNLFDLKTQVENTSGAFAKEVAELLKSLKATREKISQDIEASKASEETLTSLFAETSML